MAILPHRNMKREFELACLKAEVIKAVAHPTRLIMVEALKDGERCVCELNELFDADHSTISKHLSVLRNAGVVSDRKEGLKVFYKLEVPCILNFSGCITEVVETKARRQLGVVKGK